MSVSILNHAHKLKALHQTARSFSVTSYRNEKYDCKFLVVGGGSAGCAMAAKITNDFPSKKVIVLEPNNLHYYQPLFTLVGAGLKDLSSSHRNMKDVLPKKAKWVKDAVSSFQPKDNSVTTKEGHTISYDYMIVATGLQLNYDAIPGLVEGLAAPGSGVCSIYSPLHVQKTWQTLQATRGGEAVFTFPASPVKCPGAPQKIMYLTDSYLRDHKLRDKVKVTYYTSLGVIFGVKKYADALWKVVKGRDINVKLRTNLVEVRPKTKEAVFQNLDKPEEKITIKYSMLHVTPPMGPLAALRAAGPELVNEAGFVTVDKFSMRHTKLPNVFALGDCTDSPNSKTAAAVAAQSLVVQKNLRSLLSGKPLTAKYDGYASCPLVTGNSKCILAEFDYDLVPTETFPVNQAKERYTMFVMKKYAMPMMYWTLMTRGYWNGPGFMRSLFKPFKFN